MSASESLQSPLLSRSIGTKHTEFAVHEVQEAPAPAGLSKRGIPLHLHRTEDEGWYVLEGKLRFQHGAREFDAVAGSGVLLLHGTAHTFWNPGPTPARYLLIVRPKTAALLEALHGPRRPDPSSLRELYASFDVELVE